MNKSKLFFVVFSLGLSSFVFSADHPWSHLALQVEGSINNKSFWKDIGLFAFENDINEVNSALRDTEPKKLTQNFVDHFEHRPELFAACAAAQAGNIEKLDNLLKTYQYRRSDLERIIKFARGQEQIDFYGNLARINKQYACLKLLKERVEQL